MSANRASARLQCAILMSAACAQVMEEAISAASDGTAGFHCSLDMDFVDPKDAPGVGTAVRGGARTYREAPYAAMET